MVGDPVLLEVVGPDLLRPTTAADLAPTGLRGLGTGPILFDLEQPASQHPERLHFVLELALLVLHGDHETGRQVGDTDRRIGGVH